MKYYILLFALFPTITIYSLQSFPWSFTSDFSISKGSFTKRKQSLSNSITNFEISIGNFTITSYDERNAIGSFSQRCSRDIVLQNIKGGWGNGAHPTKKLCLEFLLRNMKPRDSVLDYGTGSGIISIFAAKLGASNCIGVDVDEESLDAAISNCKLNQVVDKVQVLHTRFVYIGDDQFPLHDITIANILPGPLTKLAATLCLLTKPNGIICLCGIRPHQLPAMKRFYEPFVDSNTEITMMESHGIYGDWILWSCRVLPISNIEKYKIIQKLSKNAMD